jgi:serine/threonine-protein kinase
VDYGVRTYAVQGVGLPVPEIKEDKELSGHFWAEVQRRGVIQAGATYIVLSLLLILLLPYVSSLVSLPTWSSTALLGILIAGFPAALYLAWNHERSPAGIVRTTSNESWQNPLKSSQRKPLTSSYIIAIIGLIIVAMYAYPRFVANPVEDSTDGYVASINDRSIAVLPFINRSDDPEQEALCIGLTEEIIHHLSRIKSFTKVIPPSSVMRLKNSDKTLAEKAALLKVNTVLEGSFQQSGDRIKITAQLNDAVNDNQLWSEIYERPFGEIFDIESDIAKNIAASVKAEITVEEEIRLSKKPTESSEAYVLLKKGRYKSRYGGSHDLQGAIDLFKKALEIDPGLAEAYTALARAYLSADISIVGDKSIPVEDPLPLVQEALRLDPEFAEGYSVLGIIKESKEWNFLEAETAFKKAVELDPQKAHLAYGYFLVKMGRAAEALSYADKAVELDPTSPNNLGSLARFYIFAGNKEKAIDIMEEYESLFQNENRGGGSGLNYLYLNRLEKAIENLEKAKENTLYSAFLAIAYTKNGQIQKAQPLVDRLKLISEKKAATSPEYSVGLYYSGIGQKEEALDWLERAYKSHDSELKWLKTEPMFKTLHGDPRYEELLRKIGFPK